MTEIAVMWIGSMITIWMYGQITALSAWMLAHYSSIATKREVKDTFLSFVIGIAFIVTQLLWSFKGLVQCQGVWMEVAGDLLALASGYYIQSSLEKRYSFYLFASQEERKRARISTTV